MDRTNPGSNPFSIILRGSHATHHKCTMASVVLGRRALATAVRGLNPLPQGPVSRKALVQDDTIDKLVNALMYDGKKATAERVVHDVCSSAQLPSARGS